MNEIDDIKFYKPTYIKHRANTKEYYKEYYLKNKEKIKQYQLKNKDKIKKQRKKYRENNKEYWNIWAKKRRKNDLKFNIKCRISALLNHCLKKNKNGYHWEKLVNYTVDDLKSHLQKTMPKGYNWEDFMNGKLHIDHIIPVSAFNFTSPKHIDFKRCWALENLQLLPAKENWSKNNKLDKPFQPSLAIKL